ncbi:MAG: cbb3-type cytochrome oxidase assembly protein CcoS [Planctomycetaceae bacterium]|nr:cbb3-type cytochrome oxidase assembly protein CcoS [Planctomycetaceae bacterium]
MSVLYLALPVALLIALGAVAAFIWSVRDGQLDDLETPALRILRDDATDEPRPKQDTPDSSADSI